MHLEIFYFEHSGRFFVPPKLICSPTATIYYGMTEVDIIIDRVARREAITSI